MELVLSIVHYCNLELDKLTEYVQLMWLTLTHSLYYRISYKGTYDSSFIIQVVNPKFHNRDTYLLHESTTL